MSKKQTELKKKKVIRCHHLILLKINLNKMCACVHKNVGKV